VLADLLEDTGGELVEFEFAAALGGLLVGGAGLEGVLGVGVDEEAVGLGGGLGA